MTEHLNNSCKPFLRWAGGKNWFVKYLPEYFKKVEINAYHEPFMGGASVFFYLQPSTAFLSDVNQDLIEMYVAVRDDVEAVINHISSWDVSSDEYYKIRRLEPDDLFIRAAKFIYLNRTSYNGIYRVNKKGQYNVPYGNKDNYKFDFQRIRNASTALQGKHLDCLDYKDALLRVKKGDLVFLDPPYTVAHNKNGFIEYNKNLFSLEDQKKLKDCIDLVEKEGAYYILTNAAHNTIKGIFSPDSEPKKLNRFSGLGGKKAKRETIEEYVFTNL